MIKKWRTLVLITKNHTAVVDREAKERNNDMSITWINNKRASLYICKKGEFLTNFLEQQRSLIKLYINRNNKTKPTD